MKTPSPLKTTAAAVLLTHAALSEHTKKPIPMEAVDMAVGFAKAENPGLYEKVLEVHRATAFETIDLDHGLFRIYHKATLPVVIDTSWDVQRRGLPGPELIKCDAEDVILPEEFSECIIRLYSEQRPEDGQWMQRPMVVSYF